MEQSLLVFEALLPVLGIVVLGALLRKFAVIEAQIERGLMQLVVQVLLPALTLVNIVGNSALKSGVMVASVAGFGFLTTAMGFGVAYFCASMLRLKRGRGRRTFAVSAGIQNYGYMGLPLLAALFPSGEVLGVLFTHNVGVDLALWTIGVALMSGNGGVSWRSLMRGPIIAVVVGLLLNALNLEILVSGVSRSILQTVGDCAVPLALLVIGAGLYDLLGKGGFSWRISLGGVFVRMLVVPALMLLLAYLLPLSEPLKQVVVVQAAMPAAMFPIVLAKHYGGRPEVAVEVVVATTTVCFVSVPIVVAVGMWFFGL